MAKVEGLANINKVLQFRIKNAKEAGEARVIVGYTADYAIYVHENLEMKWKGRPRRSGIGHYWGPGSRRSKFLEHPARAMGKELAAIIRRAMLAGATLSQALFMAGLRLQRESQLLVPIEYGNLVASAYTRAEKAVKP